jgi:hypothetical protein
LPEWLQAIAWDAKPVAYTLPRREPLHTNGYIGSWEVRLQNGERFLCWSDKQRVVVQVVGRKGELKVIHFLDLASNVRMSAHLTDARTSFVVEDVYMPNVGYFREIWSDTVRTTGRTEQILGVNCVELLGTDGNKDSTVYWHTDKYPALFADLRTWAPWLCRDGQLKFLSALCDGPANGSMRSTWPKRRFGPEAGSIAFVNISPGKSPMPTVVGQRGPVVEQRFLWDNNGGIGRLPGWMRAYVSDLRPDTLPVHFTPAAMDRDLPDNAFTGTFTAETRTLILGLAGKRAEHDTTWRTARYSYWADTRRAVLIMDDPDDEGYLFYAVDLDADVVMATHNEMSGHVIPKLYISTLEYVGLKEFGRGLDIPMTATGYRRKILGRNCTLYTTNERFLSRFWIPDKPLRNPVFDMQRWMVQRMGQKMQDLMYFGVADKPMPMAVMGTEIKSYKPGRADMPVVDLRYYRVVDERLRKREEQQRVQPEERNITIEEMMRGSEPEPPR